jgi:hypothetical protein
MVIIAAGLGPERGPAAIVNDRPILSSERKLHKNYNRKCSVENKIAGRESQGAWRQEMTGGKPPVAKKLSGVVNCQLKVSL